MNERSDISDGAALSDLAQKLVDQVALYGMASAKIRDPSHRRVVDEAKADRALLLQNVTAKMWSSDMALIDQAERLGSARQAFGRLHDPLDDRAIIREVLKGEDYLFDRFSTAIEDEHLSAHMRNYLATVVSKIQTTRENVRTLDVPGVAG